MKPVIVIIIALFFCTAATCQQRQSTGIDVGCDQMCFTACAPLTGWDGDRDAMRLTALMDAHDAQHAECDQHRVACVACLDTARKVGAIK